MSRDSALIAIGIISSGTKTLIASTDQARLLGLATAVGCVAVVADISWSGRFCRANLCSLVLVLVAIALFLVS